MLGLAKMSPQATAARRPSPTYPVQAGSWPEPPPEITGCVSEVGGDDLARRYGGRGTCSGVRLGGFREMKRTGYLGGRMRGVEENAVGGVVDEGWVGGCESGEVVGDEGVDCCGGEVVFGRHGGE